MTVIDSSSTLSASSSTASTDVDSSDIWRLSETVNQLIQNTNTSVWLFISSSGGAGVDLPD